MASTRDLNINISVSNSNMILQAYTSWNNLSHTHDFYKKGVVLPIFSFSHSILGGLSIGTSDLFFSRLSWLMMHSYPLSCIALNRRLHHQVTMEAQSLMPITRKVITLSQKTCLAGIYLYEQLKSEAFQTLLECHQEI